MSKWTWHKTSAVAGTILIFIALGLYWSGKEKEEQQDEMISAIEVHAVGDTPVFEIEQRYIPDNYGKADTRYFITTDLRLQYHMVIQLVAHETGFALKEGIDLELDRQRKLVLKQKEAILKLIAEDKFPEGGYRRE